MQDKGCIPIEKVCVILGCVRRSTVSKIRLVNLFPVLIGLVLEYSAHFVGVICMTDQCIHRSNQGIMTKLETLS